MPRTTPLTVKNPLNTKKKNKRSSKAKGKGKEQDGKSDTASQSDSCSGTDTDSACYSLESSDSLSSSSSSKPILLQLTIDYEEGSSKPKDTNPFRTNGKAEATAPKEANKAESSTKATTDPKADSKAEASTKVTIDSKTDNNGEASMKTTTKDTTTPKRDRKIGATTQAIIVPMAISKIEAATQATTVPEAGNETKVATQSTNDSKATQATTQAIIAPKTGSGTEDITEDNTISKAISQIEVALQAETFRAPRHRNTWARPRHRLKGSAELEKEKEATLTESQDNDAIDGDEKTISSQSNDAINEDEKTISSQGNGATNEDKEVAPTKSQDNGTINEDKKTTPSQDDDTISEDKEAILPEGNDGTNDDKEAVSIGPPVNGVIDEDKEETSTELQGNDTTNDGKESVSIESQDNDAINEDKKAAPTESQDNGVIDEGKNAIPSQDNDAANEDKDAASTESQGNYSTNKDKKTTPYQGNDANDKANEPLPAISQDNETADKGKEPLSIETQGHGTSDDGEKSVIDLNTNPPSEHKESLGPSSKQSASSEAIIEDKEENDILQSENHVSGALRPESTLPRTSQISESSYNTALNASESSYHTAPDASESSYHTALTDCDNEANISARPATPDLISFLPVIPPRSSSTGNLIITDALHNPIGAPMLTNSSSLKVLHSNNTSTIEAPLTPDEFSETMGMVLEHTNTAEGDMEHINAPPLRRRGATPTDRPEDTSTSGTDGIPSSKYLPDFPIWEKAPTYHTPYVLDIVKSSFQHVVVYNNLIKEREMLLKDKKELQRDLYLHHDRVERIRRALMVARTNLEDLYKKQEAHTGVMPPDWIKKEEFYRDRFYLYGKRTLNTADNMVIIGNNLNDINSTVAEIDEQVHVLQNTFRNRYSPKKKIGCISCFKKIGRIFKLKKSKN